MKWMSIFAGVGVLWAQDSMEQFNKAKELLERDPSAALEFSTKAAASNGLTQRWFWPLMLDAQVRLGKWPEAIESGAKSVESIEAGIMFTRFDQIPDEIKLRRLYASALGHMGKSEAAGVQLEIARAGGWKIKSSCVQRTRIAAQVREDRPSRGRDQHSRGARIRG